MRTVTKHQIEQIFDGAAARYDCEGPSIFRDWGARLVELLNWRASERVLDVATGRGAVLIPVAQRVGTGGFVIGVDLSNAMLHEARHATRHAGLTNSALCRMDAERLGFGGETFDVVTCAFSLFFFPALDEALREMRRVLRVGGALGVAMFGSTPPPFDPAWRIFAEQMRAYDAVVRMPSRVTYAPEELGALLTQAGFTRVETRLEQYDVVFAREEDWWAFQFTLGSRAALLQMSDTTRAKFKDEYLAQVRSLFRPDGLHLGVSVVYAIGRSQ